MDGSFVRRTLMNESTNDSWRRRKLFELDSPDLTFTDCRVDVRMIISLSISKTFLMSVPDTRSWKNLR